MLVTALVDDISCTALATSSVLCCGKSTPPCASSILSLNLLAPLRMSLAGFSKFSLGILDEPATISTPSLYTGTPFRVGLTPLSKFSTFCSTPSSPITLTPLGVTLAFLVKFLKPASPTGPSTETPPTANSSTVF